MRLRIHFRQKLRPDQQRSLSCASRVPNCTLSHPVVLFRIALQAVHENQGASDGRLRDAPIGKLPIERQVHGKDPLAIGRHHRNCAVCYHPDGLVGRRCVPCTGDKEYELSNCEQPARSSHGDLKRNVSYGEPCFPGTAIAKINV